MQTLEDGTRRSDARVHVLRPFDGKANERTPVQANNGDSEPGLVQAHNAT